MNAIILEQCRDVTSTHTYRPSELLLRIPIFTLHRIKVDLLAKVDHAPPYGPSHFGETTLPYGTPHFRKVFFINIA